MAYCIIFLMNYFYVYVDSRRELSPAWFLNEFRKTSIGGFFDLLLNHRSLGVKLMPIVIATGVILFNGVVLFSSVGERPGHLERLDAAIANGREQCISGLYRPNGLTRLSEAPLGFSFIRVDESKIPVKTTVDEQCFYRLHVDSFIDSKVSEKLSSKESVYLKVCWVQDLFYDPRSKENSLYGRCIYEISARNE